MEDSRDAAGQQIDLLKVLLQASGAPTAQLQAVGASEVEEDDGPSELQELRYEVLGTLVAMNQELRERDSAPRDVIRDSAGKAVSIGGRPVRYSADGRIEGIG